MEFLINQFVLFEIGNNIGIQNGYGFTLIKNEKIINFFKYIDSKNKLEINDEELKYFFDSEKEKIIQFLVNEKLVSIKAEKSNYSNIYFYTNNSLIDKSLNFNKVGSEIPITSIYLSNSIEIAKKLKSTNFTDNDLVIVSLVPFNYTDFTDLCNVLNHKNTMYAVSFSYNSCMYITNVHKKIWYNPCPKCFFSQLEASLRSYNKNTSEITFQTIVDIIYNKKLLFNPSLPLNNSNVLSYINSIIDMTKLDANINDLSGRIVKCFLNGNIKYDQAIHWELCDCFE